MNVYFWVAIGIFLAACVGLAKLWLGGREISARSDATKLIISAERRRARQNSMERVIRDA